MAWGGINMALVAYAAWAGCQVTVSMVNMTDMGWNQKKTSSKSINPLVVVHRCHSDRTRYKFDISLAKRDIKGYQLNQT